jgi:prepilin peptidase CpaA
MDAHLEATEGQPLLTPEDGVDASSIDPAGNMKSPHRRNVRSIITQKNLILYLGVILLLVAAYSDVTTLKIPNLLCAAVTLLGIIRLILIGNIKIALYTVGVSLLVFIAGSAMFVHKFIGGGDVKLISATALLIGYRGVIGFLLLLVICGVIQCTIQYIIAGTASVPYGITIAVAGSVMLWIQNTSSKTMGIGKIDHKSAKAKPCSNMNFLTKHWRGEYSLPRSFWLHGVLLGSLLMVVSSLLLEETGPGWLVFIVIGGWQIGGVWRSAARRGDFWAKAAKCSIGLISAVFISSYTDSVKEHLHRLEIEHQRPSSTSLESPPINPAAYTQPWKQVGEWEVRYDSLDAGDGTSSGCFMVRAYGNSALRIGVHGDNYYVLFTNSSVNANIDDRKHYMLSLKIGEYTPWSIKTQAKTFNSGNKYLVFHTSDQRLFAELVRSNSLTISQSGTAIFEFTVTGAKEALATMLNCQESHRRNPYKSS